MTTKPATMKTLREITAEKQAARLRFTDHTRTVLCDLYTASMIVSVYDRCAPAQQAIIDLRITTSDGFKRVLDACFKVMGGGAG